MFPGFANFELICLRFFFGWFIGFVKVCKIFGGAYATMATFPGWCFHLLFFLKPFGKD